MTTTNQTIIREDVANRKLIVTRTFEAPLEQVWKAWTEKDLLDQWWAPKPWKAETRSMDFREGGMWLYCMVGPDGERSWARADFEKIIPQRSYSGFDSFCDEEGNIISDPPGMHWAVYFSGSGDTTTVTVEVSFKTEEDFRKIVEMGFKEGFTAAHSNLDALLAR